ncbi:MAG: serine/threonine-protein kinase [Kofleriaceae bacterium]
MVETIAVILIFGGPVYVAKKIVEARNERHKREHEAKMAQLGHGAAAPSSKELGELREERKLLVERIQNLETIVCSVDFELNQKVSRLLEEQRLGLPAGPAAPAVSEPEPAEAAEAVAPTAPRRAPSQPAPEPAAKADLGHSPTLTQAAAKKPDPPAESISELRPGAVLANRYRVQRLLGRGGMGAVYLCDDEVLGELVALKVISSAWATDQAAMIERFKREAQAARRVSSPNVIRIHDLGEASGRFLYLSMEYFPGRTMSQVMAQRGLVPLKDCHDYLGQICDGLAAAHDVGVIHRDLKPGNVLIGERGAVKIIDFGLAKATAVEGMTATGALLGTPHYMAPEQIRGKNVDARADVYALGALAFHLLTGRPPFGGDNAIAVGFAHLTEAPPTVRSLRPEVPEALDEMIGRALAKDPATRPGDARAFRAAIDG